jgi:hypothetical protein
VDLKDLAILGDSGIDYNSATSSADGRLDFSGRIGVGGTGMRDSLRCKGGKAISQRDSSRVKSELIGNQFHDARWAIARPDRVRHRTGEKPCPKCVEGIRDAAPRR